jgi:hypothetical protein
MDKNSYLRENWNRLDFFVVLISLIEIYFIVNNNNGQ